jgi:hypothetical protein
LICFLLGACVFVVVDDDDNRDTRCLAFADFERTREFVFALRFDAAAAAAADDDDDDDDDDERGNGLDNEPGSLAEKE